VYEIQCIANKTTAGMPQGSTEVYNQTELPGPPRPPAELARKDKLMKALYALFLATPLFAQTTLPGGVITTPIVLQQTYTTGLVGFTTNQTARLNVLNLNPQPSTTSTVAPANCIVALQFYDNKGAMVSQYVVSNFAPGTSTSFDLTRATVTSETSARAEIRGVVAINPAPSLVESPAPVGNCSVFTTLEIFDATGSTIALTSDVRPVGLQLFSTILTAIKQ
jgi:hypothetical protein